MGGGGPPDTKHGQYLGGWGNLGSPTQKGVVTYSISPNRQRPLAGTAHAAVFNVWRRFRAQALFFIPPLALAYFSLEWATHKNEYYNSKQGRLSAEAQEAELDGGSVRA